MSTELKRNLTSGVRQQQIEWRRTRVLELSSKGYNQRDRQLDKSAVNRDIQFLKQQARDNLQHHINEVIPFEYHKAMTELQRNLKETLEIAETASDPRTKLAPGLS